MLRVYDVKVSGDHRTVRFDAAKCPTWDGPQSQVEALLGKLLGLGHPHKVDNFQLLDLRVGFISARCSMGRITTRDVELCKEDDEPMRPRVDFAAARLLMDQVAAAPVVNYAEVEARIMQINAPAPEPAQQWLPMEGGMIFGQAVAPNNPYYFAHGVHQIDAPLELNEPIEAERPEE